MRTSPPASWSGRCEFSRFSAFDALTSDRVYRKALSPELNEAAPGLLAQIIYPFQHAPIAALSGLAAFGVGLVAAWKLYANAKEDPLPARLGALATAMRNRFYFDELYETTVIRAHDSIAAVADWIDRWLVEGFCIGLVRGGTDFTGRALRLVQTGNLQTYAFLFVLGVAVVLWFVLGK